jgi:hypothetical protein
MKSNADVKKVINRVKVAQSQLKILLKNQTWAEEARKYAEKQSKEVKKLFAGDVAKVKTFLERNQKELEKFQAQIPSEVEKFKKYVTGQRKELERLLKNVRRAAKTGKTGGASRKAGTRKKAAKKTSDASTS